MLLAGDAAEPGQGSRTASRVRARPNSPALILPCVFFYLAEGKLCPVLGFRLVKGDRLQSYIQAALSVMHSHEATILIHFQHFINSSLPGNTAPADRRLKKCL